jgi:DNA-binding NarL/FixJ family response regulator
LLEQASRQRPEVVVADHSLLGKDVRRAIEAVRRANPGAKVVLIVSFDWKRADAGDFPVDACIRKSCIVRNLVPTVEALARRGKRRSKTNGGFNERAPRGVRMK